MKVGVIGLGLIGGSFAMEMKRQRHEVIGSDKNSAHALKAKELKIVDDVMDNHQLIAACDLIVLATPVQAIARLLPEVLDQIGEQQLVIDLGSTKAKIVNEVEKHPMRRRYLACHPMAGTEFSGPEAAVPNLFRDAFMVICDSENTDADVQEKLESLFIAMGMKITTYTAEAHDRHAAYISHISHISSFALALTVLDKEKNEEDIFKLAAGGFTSTVRLAKSAAETWTPIFSENRERVLDVLDAHMKHLADFKKAIHENDQTALDNLIHSANRINKIV